MISDFDGRRFVRVRGSAIALAAKICRDNTTMPTQEQTPLRMFAPLDYLEVTSAA